MEEHTEIVRNYAHVGLVAYVEYKVEQLRAEGKSPSMVIVGQIEWIAILECELTDEYVIAGVPVIPDMNFMTLVSIK